MTFPGYTFAVQRLQKQTNNILDSIAIKLAQLAQLIGQVKTNQTNNKNAIIAKLDLILDKLESLQGLQPGYQEIEEEDEA